MGKRTVKTSKEQIADYWRPLKYEGDMGCDWCDALERCWRCGIKRSLTRCHIIPHQEPDAPHNLVLLCAWCHDEAPCCDEPNAMWEWIEKTHSVIHGDLWGRQYVEALERDTGKHSEDLFKGIDLKAFLASYKIIRSRRAGTHTGDSTNTVVWAIKQTLKAMRTYQVLSTQGNGIWRMVTKDSVTTYRPATS
jgi:hypothetical protein